ncbi:hypothetical protein [Quatrionicoccus australiensis]|uniref:hypothetical protein n=1 Tax=Quatrionicoccus australiensis TaxID=138118 RepID=UPI001CF8A0EB|nr:hypothetical protein [Quatrionicoccus australiensis]UCV14440.1 hypothetical protein KI612_16070 [Quatrionicoccus australiensis]
MIETQANELKNRSEMMNMLALRIEEDAGNPETSADIVEGVLEIDTASENRQKARETVLSFVQSYRHKPEGTLDAAWLDGEFSKYPTIWEDADERKNTALIVVERVQRFEEEKQKLAEYRERGLSRESYLKSAIESGAKAQGVNNVGSYAAEIDHTLDQANKDNIDLMYRRDGGINQSWHLDGFIAEQHHAESFNIEAAAQGSPYRAEVLKPAPGQTYGKNSVDIVIRDGNGKIVKRYQSKYGTDAESTKELFEKGDYRGQRKLVPEGQGKDIKNSTEVIEHEGVKSKPLSKEDAKERQRKIQEEREAKQYEWNDVNSKAIAKNIGQKAGVAAMLAVGFQGARVLGRRIWNSMTGQANSSIEEDAAEFAESALKSGASAGLTVAVTGGLVVVCRSGWLGAVLRRTPAGQIANAVCIGIENVKVLADFASGKITGEEALDRAGDATCSLVGSLALGVEGATLGASIGSALGPIGTFVGGIAGGLVGGIAGSTVGRAVWEGGKTIAKTVANSVKSAASSLWEGTKSVASSVGNFIGSVFSW